MSVQGKQSSVRQTLLFLAFLFSLGLFVYMGFYGTWAPEVEYARWQEVVDSESGESRYWAVPEMYDMSILLDNTAPDLSVKREFRGWGISLVKRGTMPWNDFDWFDTKSRKFFTSEKEAVSYLEKLSLEYEDLSDRRWKRIRKLGSVGILAEAKKEYEDLKKLADDQGKTVVTID